MKSIIPAILAGALLVHSACSSIEPDGKEPAEAGYSTNTPGPDSVPEESNETPLKYRNPPADARWQIQYSGDLDIDMDVDVFNLDLFESDQRTIAELHERGVFVMCYFSAGSYEDWRPDKDQFPTEVLGKDLEDWPGERWLDIRQIDLLEPVMRSRLELAVEKGCDGVDPDNINGYENNSGFPLSGHDQTTYNLRLSEMAHSLGLSIGLKNDHLQAASLEPYFDWALSEQCFFFDECDLLTPFLENGKPVFNIEYELDPSEFCTLSNEMGINSIHKNLELDEYIEDCL